MGNRVASILKLAWQVLWPVLFIEAVGMGMVFLFYPSWDLQAITTLSDLLVFVSLYAVYLHAKNARCAAGARESAPGNRRRTVSTALFLALFAASSCVVLNEALTLLGIENWSPGYEEVEELLFSVGLWRQIFLTVAAAPLMEELIFRGICYERLRKHMGVFFSVFWSALLFGTFHGNLLQGLYGFAMGLLLALVYETYHSLGAAVWFHACANLTSILLVEWTADLPAQVLLPEGIVFLLAAAVMGNGIRMVLIAGKDSADRS